MTEKKTQVEQGGAVSAKLKKPHRHRGIHYPAGAEVTLTKAQAERLTRREVI
ncbi:MAG TPA: hypothetical protein VFN01_00430 [Marinobacter sp.]|uniref:DUF7210 family protein n=1 Tax=Marinobacter sp. TaxID=50741 RepID=UPI002D7E652B|nr:hypothetical protein [Marinobacter sp.]HET8799623.1 hypothetical protein [Marinobacter sp.]